MYFFNFQLLVFCLQAVQARLASQAASATKVIETRYHFQSISFNCIKPKLKCFLTETIILCEIKLHNCFYDSIYVLNRHHNTKNMRKILIFSVWQTTNWKRIICPGSYVLWMNLISVTLNSSAEFSSQLKTQNLSKQSKRQIF